jgi:hypothetical protein
MVRHILWATGGTVSFWLPIILVFAVERANTNMILANLMATLGFLLCWVIRRWFDPRGRQAIWMLLGLYLLGPILLSTATTFANGGFAQIHEWTDVGWLLFACVFPPVQFLLVATSGLWPSLLFATVILVCVSVMERTRAVI